MPKPIMWVIYTNFQTGIKALCAMWIHKMPKKVG